MAGGIHGTVSATADKTQVRQLAGGNGGKGVADGVRLAFTIPAAHPRAPPPGQPRSLSAGRGAAQRRPPLPPSSFPASTPTSSRVCRQPAPPPTPGRSDVPPPLKTATRGSPGRGRRSRRGETCGEVEAGSDPGERRGSGAPRAELCRASSLLLRGSRGVVPAGIPGTRGGGAGDAFREGGRGTRCFCCRKMMRLAGAGPGREHRPPPVPGVRSLLG